MSVCLSIYIYIVFFRLWSFLNDIDKQTLNIRIQLQLAILSIGYFFPFLLNIFFKNMDFLCKNFKRCFSGKNRDISFKNHKINRFFFTEKILF